MTSIRINHYLKWGELIFIQFKDWINFESVLGLDQYTCTSPDIKKLSCEQNSLAILLFTTFIAIADFFVKQVYRLTSVSLPPVITLTKAWSAQALPPDLAGSIPRWNILYFPCFSGTVGEVGASWLGSSCTTHDTW